MISSNAQNATDLRDRGKCSSIGHAYDFSMPGADAYVSERPLEAPQMTGL